MTKYLTQKAFAGLLAITLLMSAAASARADQIEQWITVLRVSGQARYSTDAMRSWKDCKKGDHYKPGTLIQTADGATVDIVLGERVSVSPTIAPLSMPNTPLLTMGSASAPLGPKANAVHIYGNTVVSVDKLTLDRTGMDEVSETQLDLRAGQILGNVKKISSTSRYEIKIPNGVAGIRGTTFMIGANGTVFVLTGSVVISYVDNTGTLQTATITAGNSYTPPSNGVGPGASAPISAPVLTVLKNTYANLPNPPSGPTTVTTGGSAPIVVHISPN